MNSSSTSGIHPRRFGRDEGRKFGRDQGRWEGRMEGIVALGAPAAHPRAETLIEEMTKEIQARTGWDLNTVKALIANGFSQSEADELAKRHAAVTAKLHGIVALGRKKGPFDFLSQFDPTWPKAKFGQVIRAALVDVGATVGIPVASILDSTAGMAQQFQGHPAAGPGPLPPMPHPMPHGGGGMELHRPPPKKWSIGKKVLVTLLGGAAIWGGYELMKPRKTNPRKRRHHNARKHHTRRR